MDREAVKERLYEKYIAPIRKKRKKYIGIEIEMPVVNLSGAPTDYGAAQAAAAAFRRHFGFVPQSFDDDGVCYCAAEPETGTPSPSTALITIWSCPWGGGRAWGSCRSGFPDMCRF